MKIIKDLIKDNLLDNVPVIIAVHDLELNMVWANKAYQTATGLSLQEIEGKKCYSVWSLSNPCQNCPVLKVIQTGKQAEAELTPENQNDWPYSQGSWLSKAAPLKDETGKVVGVIETAFEISEKKATESKLIESQTKLLETQKIAKLGGWELDLIANELIGTEEIYKIFELDSSKLRLSIENFHDLVHPNDKQKIDTAYRESIINATPYHSEYRLLMKDGRIKTVYEKCQIFYDDESKPIRIIGTIQDITQLRQVELKAQRWQQVFDHAKFGLAYIDVQNYSFIETNKSFAHERGYEPEELIGKPLLQIYPPEEREKVKRQFKEIDNSDHSLFESIHQRKDGSKFPVLVETTTIMDKNNKPISRVGVSIDITKQVESKEKLRKSEERLRRFYDTGLLGVIYWNMEGVIVDANDKFLDMIGYTREELNSGEIDWINMTPEEFRHLDQETLIELKSTGVQKVPFEKEYFRKDGSRIPILISGAFLDEKQFNGVAFVVDITERKKTENENQKLQKKLQQNQKMESIGTLAGGIAHDFNNILSSILGFTELALNSVEKGSELEDDLQEVRIGGMRAKDLVKQILTFARQSDELVKPIQLKPIIKEVMKLLKASIPSTISISADINR